MAVGVISCVLELFLYQVLPRPAAHACIMLLQIKLYLIIFRGDTIMVPYRNQVGESPCRPLLSKTFHRISTNCSGSLRLNSYGRYFNGFTGLSFLLISKCRCDPVAFPVDPTSPITSPAFTHSQGFMRFL